MKSPRVLSAVLCAGLFLPFFASAETLALTYRYQHHLLTLDPDTYPAWRTTEEVWLYGENEIKAPAELRVDGDTLPPLPGGIVRTTRTGWNADAIAATIEKNIGGKLNREKGSVTISRDGSGAIVFDGVGLTGRSVDSAAAAALTVAALENGVTDILLPVHETQPALVVHDAELQDRGINEVVTVGESDFTGSPAARRHNINVGLDKFNGFIVPRGEEFSFNEALGPVGPATGYWKELVIKGDETLPDYGGGLCQVSSTAYRGAWEYGFPITQRHNHSYAVKYYAPYGTDATIYPPGIDMTFLNDGPSDLLLQTHVDTGSSLAYFIYYGTRDTRSTDLIGPFIWGHTAAPPPMIGYTTEIPPGEVRKAGGEVPGMKAQWYRIVYPASGTGEIIEHVFSPYEARPLYHQIGVAVMPEKTEEPSWIGRD